MSAPIAEAKIELPVAAKRSLNYDEGAELTAEREKVRLLRLACESICDEWGRNHDANPIGAGQRMSTIAGKVLEKVEQD